MATGKAGGDSARYGWVFWILVVYFIFHYIRPQELFPPIAGLRIPLMLTLLLAMLWLFKADKRMAKDPLVVLFGLFIVLCATTVLWAHNTYWVSEVTQILTAYLIASALPAAAFLNDRRKLATFFTIWVGIHLFVAYYSITHEGRGTGSFLGDENDMALTINMAIPYAYFLLQSRSRGWLFKLAMLGAIIAMGFAIINSDSRGGLVGLFAVTGGIIFFTKHRIRNAIVLGILAGAAYWWVPETYVEDMQTMVDPEDATRYERIYSWRLGWHMFLDYPIAGVGAGNYPWRVEHYEERQGEYTGRRSLGGRAAHSLYFTLIPELGLIGIALFGGMAVLMFKRLVGVIRREEKLVREASGPGAPPSEANLLARAMMVSMLALFSSGAFISVLYYPHFWVLIGFVLALHYATSPQRATARAERAAQAPGGAALAGKHVRGA